MNGRRTLDVSRLAPGAFGHRSILWWGTMGIVLIEGTMFALSIGAYFYLRSRSETWPPNLPPPDLRWGRLNTRSLFGTAIPNDPAKRPPEKIVPGAFRSCFFVSFFFAAAFNLFRFLNSAT